MTPTDALALALVFASPIIGSVAGAYIAHRQGDEPLFGAAVGCFFSAIISMFGLLSYMAVQHIPH